MTDTIAVVRALVHQHQQQLHGKRHVSVDVHPLDMSPALRFTVPAEVAARMRVGSEVVINLTLESVST